MGYAEDLLFEATCTLVFWVSCLTLWGVCFFVLGSFVKTVIGLFKGE